MACLKSDIPVVHIFGIPVHRMRMSKLLDLCERHIADRSSLLLGVVNVAKAVNSRKDEQLRKSLEDADVILADGCGIVWLSKLMGTPLPERIAGIDIMCRLFERADQHGYRVYFLGARKEVVKKVVGHVHEHYLNVQVAGYRDGYFDELQEQEVAEDIRDSCADIIFVAMSSPKKEKFLSKWRQFMNVPVCHGVGGSFDVVAGVTKRAPVWMQKFGLEWFYRVLQEPKRMWKRYLVTNCIFVMLSIVVVVRARLGKSKACS